MKGLTTKTDQTFSCSLSGVLLPGCLIQLQAVGLLDEYYFIAVAMRKPHLHVLVRGHPCSSTEISILESDSGQPAVLTSHQLFERVLSITGVEETGLVSIPFVIHTYSVKPFQNLQSVFLESAVDGREFSTQSQPTNRGKPSKTKLPFGIENSPRKRKPKAGKQRRPAAQGNASSKVSKSSHGLARVMGEALPESSSISSSSSSSAPSSGSESSDSSSDSDPEALEKMILTPEAAEEERQTALVLESHDKLTELRSQAQAAHPSSSGARPLRIDVPKREATYCNPIVGLVDVGLQVAARLAKCRHCSNPIPQQGARFAYSFHRQKFAGWVHADCIFPYLKQQGACLQQALAFIQKAKADPHWQHRAPQIIEAVCKLEASLEDHMGRDS